MTIFTLDIAQTLEALLNQEDTDRDKKITAEDKGPKSCLLYTSDAADD